MRQTPRPFLLLVFSLFALEGHTRAQSNRLSEIVQQLRLIETHKQGWPSTDVPPAAQELLPQMRAELRALIGRTINEHATSSPETMRTFLLASLRTAGVAQLSEEHPGDNSNRDADKFGFVEDVQVRQPARHPDLLTVVISLTIPCGDDDSLTVFRRIGSLWQPILFADANGYTQVSGAQGWLKYAISPPDEEGNWFLVTANVTPWCSSNWQGLNYKVLRRGDSPEMPHTLMEEHRSVYLGVDEPFRLAITSGSFEIHNVASQSLDAGILTRVHLQKYRVAGDKVTRVPPFALLPEDFLDEWFSLGWDEASQCISASEKSDLQRWHQRFNDSERHDDFYTEFDFVQPCPSVQADARWQIGLVLEGSSDKDLPEGLPEELFFTLIKRDGAFYVDDVAEERPAGCPGESRARGSSLNSSLP